MGLDFEIVYKPGSDNRAADALSRRMTYSTISMVQFSDLAEWEEEVQAEGKLRGLMQDLLQHSYAHPGYAFRDRKLWYKGKLVQASY